MRMLYLFNLQLTDITPSIRVCKNFAGRWNGKMTYFFPSVLKISLRKLVKLLLANKDEELLPWGP